MIVKDAKPKRTAAEVVLLAAATFEGEFSEWDLTVACWQLDKLRFGMRGYADVHPDHKRLYMEITGNKASSPIQQKYIERTRPNFMRLTTLGKSMAASIGGVASAGPTPTRLPSNDLYAAVAVYLQHPAFIQWKANPAEPKDIASARDCLAVHSGMDGARRAIRLARLWCRDHGVEMLTWYAAPVAHGPQSNRSFHRQPIHIADLADLDDFLTAMSYRFPALNSQPKAKRA